MKIGESVKIIGKNPGFTGQIGTIQSCYDKDNEIVYTVKFINGTFIKVFEFEIKSVELCGE